MRVERGKDLLPPRAAAGGAMLPPPVRRMRVAIFIEHDILYRHFVQSRAFGQLSKKADVTFVFAAPSSDNKRLTTTLDPAEIGAPVELLPVEPQRVFYWRRLFQVSQLVWRPGADWKHLRAITRYFLGRNASILSTVLALPVIYPVFHWLTHHRINRLPSKMEQLVARLRPDVLVHPTVFDGYFINDFVLVGRRIGIPTVAIMNSWDNPSSKRSVVGQPDRVLVWGPQTKAHAAKYMGMNPDRIMSFGAAQFEIYERPARITRDEFCRRHKLDPNKRLLLYAGSSKGADEFEHLRLIEAAIDRGELQNAAIIYRPHPWGAGGYKGERLLDYPWQHVAIDMSMRSYLEIVRAGRKNAKFLADYADTHDTLSCIDALVSPLSTIILEAALHGKPVLCLMADSKSGSSFDLQKRLVHFEDLYNCPVVLMAHDENELVPKLTELLSHVGDEAFAANLRAACRHFVADFDKPFSERIFDALEQVVAKAGA
jgi:hypothetical protein